MKNTYGIREHVIRVIMKDDKHKLTVEKLMERLSLRSLGIVHSAALEGPGSESVRTAKPK